MKFDPTRNSSYPNEVPILAPTVADDDASIHRNPLDYHDAVKQMCEIYKPNTSAAAFDVISPIFVTLDPPRSQAQACTGLIASWDDLVRNGVGLGDGVGAPAALEPDEVVQGNKEPEEVETWEELVRGEAVLGEGGRAELDMRMKERLWSKI